ncbi:MAG: class I SAM-dependent methyltransferase, partial [Patescibacteria group bacterium]
AVVAGLFQNYGRKGWDFLDVGCGTCEGASIVSNMGGITGIDMSDEALSIAKNKGYVSLCKGSGERLPFAEKIFDSLIMLDVLEHIDDDRATLNECFRVLKPSGTIFITVPAHQWLWSGHDEVLGHKRRYQKSKLLEKTKQAGFEIIFCSYYFSFTFPAVILFRLIEKLVRNKKSSHFFHIPRWFNITLLFFMRCEGHLLKLGLPTPFGSSLILVARRHTD